MLQARTCAGIAVLAMSLSVVAGHAAGEKVEAAAAPKLSATKVEAPAAHETSGAKLVAPVAHERSAAKLAPPVALDPPAPAGPSVAKLADGREGFVITEVPTMDEASRGDFDRAVAMLNDQDYARAIDLLEKVIERSPGVTAPYIDIAIAYRRTGKPERAEEHLRTALTLFPGHPVACNEYGLLHRKAGRFAEARAIYEKAVERFPDYYPAHRNLGILCDLYMNDPACALEHYEIYGKARPDDAQVALWIADVRARLGRR